MRSPQKNAAPRFELKNRRGFGEAYDYYAPRLYRYILIRTGSPEETEDLVSKTFLKMLEYLRSGKRIRNPGAFLYKTADNLLIDFYRSRAILQEKIVEMSAAELDPAVSDSLAEKVAIREDSRRMLEFLNALSERDQELLVLRFVEDLTLDEMAKILEKSKGSISVAIHRALKNLREIISEKENDTIV